MLTEIVRHSSPSPARLVAVCMSACSPVSSSVHSSQIHRGGDRHFISSHSRVRRHSISFFVQEHNICTKESPRAEKNSSEIKVKRQKHNGSRIIVFRSFWWIERWRRKLQVSSILCQSMTFQYCKSTIPNEILEFS